MVSDSNTMRKMGNMFSGNILAIGAHPDDIEYGVFGTLYKYRNDCSIFCYVSTYGGEGDITSSVDRRIESEKALNILHPKHIYWINQIGIHLGEYSDIVSELEKIVYLNKINLVMTPSKSDSHQDHRMISDITVSALRRSNATLLFYPTLTTVDFCAKLFVDITKTYRIKKRALSLLTTQRDKSYMKNEYLEVFNHDSHASLHGLGYVEKFDIGGAFL
jgi:N-acetylglucosamine malate deacetylase 1